MGLPATASHFDPSHSPEEVQRVWFKSSRKLEKPDGPMRARAPVEAAVFAIPACAKARRSSREC